MRSVTSFWEPLPRSPQPLHIPWRSNKSLPGEHLARHHGTRAAHLGSSVTCQKLTRAQWWSRAITSESSSTNIIKTVHGKGIGPTCGSVASPKVGSGATVGTLQTGYPCAQDLKNQPHGFRPALSAKELCLCHVPRGTEHTTRQERAPVSPCVPWQ
jgi:hypothetical protein